MIAPTDSENNLISEGSYISTRGHVLKIRRASSGFEYRSSGNFEKDYQLLSTEIARTLIPLKGALEARVMPVFNLLATPKPGEIQSTNDPEIYELLARLPEPTDEELLTTVHHPIMENHL